MRKRRSGMEVSDARSVRLMNAPARRLWSLERWVPRLVTVIALLLVATPLLTVTVASFRPGMILPFQSGPWTGENFVTAFGSSVTYRLLLNTFLYTLVSLTIGL